MMARPRSVTARGLRWVCGGAGFARFRRFLNHVGNQYFSVIGCYDCFYSHYAQYISIDIRNMFVYNVINVHCVYQ
jgi:hypothetical protein